MHQLPIKGRDAASLLCQFVRRWSEYWLLLSRHRMIGGGGGVVDDYKPLFCSPVLSLTLDSVATSAAAKLWDCCQATPRPTS